VAPDQAEADLDDARVVGTRAGRAVPDVPLQAAPTRTTLIAPQSAGQDEEATLVDHIYRVTEIVGTSSDGLEAAIRNGVARAARTLHNLDWFEVTEIRGHLADGQVGHFQVGLKVGFRLDDE
jgi:flavin-binding protein dodecin